MSLGSRHTQATILDAARSEFAVHGLAGGRVDRIAKAAGANVQRIYAYFTDKQGLFDAVVRDAAEDLAAALGTPSDLCGLAGAIFDHVSENPEKTRIMTWARLEREDEFFRMMAGLAGPTPISQVARLQEAGLVTDRWDSATILEAIVALCERWDGRSRDSASSDALRHRELVVGFARTCAVQPPPH